MTHVAPCCFGTWRRLVRDVYLRLERRWIQSLSQSGTHELPTLCICMREQFDRAERTSSLQCLGLLAGTVRMRSETIERRPPRTVVFRRRLCQYSERCTTLALSGARPAILKRHQPVVCVGKASTQSKTYCTGDQDSRANHVAGKWLTIQVEYGIFITVQNSLVNLKSAVVFWFLMPPD